MIKICYKWGNCNILWKDANWTWDECRLVEEIIGSTNQSNTSQNIQLDPFFGLGADLNGNRDTIVVSLTTLGSVACPTYAALSFREII